MTSAAGLKILYLDDSELHLREVQRTLSAAGYDVLTAESVAEARSKCGSVDLVMIDFHMPGLNGAEALRVLKPHVRSDVVVLFYLYTSDRDVAMAFKTHGFDGAFIAKGEENTLISQVQAAHRMVKLKRFRSERTVG